MTGELFFGRVWATGGPWSAKSDLFWVDIFKPKWNLSYIDGARLRDSEEYACGLCFPAIFGYLKFFLFFDRIQGKNIMNNLKPTPQGLCVTRFTDGEVAFGAIPIW